MKFKGRDAQYFLDCCVLYVAEHGGLTSKSLWDIHKNHGMSKTLPKEYSVPVFLRMSPYFKMGEVTNNSIGAKWYLTTEGVQRVNAIFVKGSYSTTKFSQILEKYSALVNLNFCETMQES